MEISIVDAVVTELNEKAKKMGKMKKEREEGKEINYQIKPTYSVLNLVAPLQHKTRQVLLIINNRNREKQPKRSSLVVTATKSLNSKVTKTI